MAEALCEVCGVRPEFGGGCPRARTLMCVECHAAARLAYVCPCYTAEQAANIVNAIAKEEEETTMAAKKKAKPKDWTGAMAASNGAGGGDYVERDRFEEALPCKIAAEVADERARTLAAIVHEHDQLLERKREVNANFREKLSFYRERMKQLSESVKDSTELRPVKCVERLNVKRNTVEVVRQDTLEVVSSRAATAEDRQEPLPIEGASKGKREKKAKDEDPGLILGDE
jgi:hypothetical protein